MKNKDIISLLFDAKENADLFNFKNEELNKLVTKKVKYSNLMYNYISQRVHPNSQKKLNYFIEKYLDTNFEYFYQLNKLFYQTGFIDGLNLGEKTSNN